jgi:hypothetical protein
MKKLLSLLLVLLLTLSLAFMATACSSDSDKDDDDDKKPSTSQEKEEVSIIGKWVAEIDMADIINESMEAELGSELDKKFSDINVNVIMEFDKKEYEISMDAGDVEKAVKNQMPDILKSLLEVMLEKSGTGMTVDQLLAAQNMTMDDFIEQTMAQMDFEEITGELDVSETSLYELDGKKLYTFEEEKDEDEYMEIELSSKKLVVKSWSTSEELPEGMEEFMNGLEFKKVK